MQILVAWEYIIKQRREILCTLSHQAIAAYENVARTDVYKKQKNKKKNLDSKELFAENVSVTSLLPKFVLTSRHWSMQLT